ncbi:acyl-CoA dehydrogenase family protein [Virgibacillus halodenitrificans]|uniref:Acyl-CoA dehydrogenase n=1 Tax=Virgibacillus halodenitrificans TaxID=1482 RepID=A0AAC9IZ48_VIRHA|nr:acyl-CoA dehydrogenase family protein [Virgibacillus halodenitrificans]APC48516.1 acyl-CoA dehydrogenase [Virgibacillus halodenitrificans]MBD1224265.1 acyl-CoA dehydrogenase family protein [Virgibacillus halodenitrificans]MCJ0931091.1 acyl-CoA dehydrogenase family protein [Virgibacillus halodenitrificans]WHX27273.1 acyl-CoA dehydrogenase family protein [Virgibacillus halodenitrificans]
MNFELTKEQAMIKKMVRDFAEEVIRPRAIEIDTKAEFPKDIFDQLGELGLMGIPFPGEYGGSGGDTLSYALAVEEIGRVCGSTGLSYAAAVSLGASPIYYFGTEEQKKEFLTPLAEGKALGAFGLTEPNAGSDAGGTKTTAVEDGDDYVINGEKCFITNASFAKTVIVTAVTGKNEKGKNIISAIIVPTDCEGIKITSNYDKMGVRGSDTAEIVLTNVRVPKKNLLGDPEKGFKQFLHTLDGGRISIAALGLGIAQGSLDKALTYAKERKQFGKPISSFQAIQFKLADMSMEVELARNMVHKAAWLKDNHKPFSKEAAYAKLYATETAFRSANQAIQIHGGYGYMREYEVERYLRDAKLLEIGEGTSEVQRLVIARQLGC